ncbi:MAG: Hpt domain-containing protein [Gammaproteobacteria bacterium]|nr:Hpt domain-containing protein [Gammaproteobacteria bacterium]
MAGFVDGHGDTFLSLWDIDFMALEYDSEVDGDLLKDFLEDFVEKQRELEGDLMRLEAGPDDQELLANIFRAVHTIKGNACFCKMEPVSQFAHSLEELLQVLRVGTMSFSPQLGEVVLLSMDRLNTIVQCFVAGESQEVEQNKKIEESLTDISSVQGGEQYAAIQYSLCLLSESFDDLGSDFDLSAESGEADSAASCGLEGDLDYFYLLMKQCEQRSIFWQGRGERILALAMEMNALAGTPVEPYKLTAAIYLHDFAMGLLPEFIISKNERLNESELAQLRNHPLVAAQLVERLSGWEGVSEMILQHHERVDGNGYPKQLKGDAICEGAQLISVVDAYISLTRPRADRLHKRSVMRAILELNNNKSTQFSERWVRVLNTVVKQHYLNPA